MIVAACDVAVEVAFGYGPLDDVPDVDWIDVTDDLESPTVSATTGRDGAMTELTPGRLRCELDNSAGTYNPRNEDGPHFGQLLPGVPIRVTTTYDGTTETRWRGMVEGWPQQVTDYLPTVELTAVDVLGWLANTDAPETVLSAFASTLSPDHWWSVTAEGWIDVASDIAGRHTGGLVEYGPDSERFQPPVNGDPLTWGGDGDGWAVVETPAAFIVPTAAVQALSVWCQLPDRASRATDGVGQPLPIVLVSQQATISRSATTRDSFTLSVEADTVTLTIDADAYGRYSFTWDASLMDGRAHHVFVGWEARDQLVASPADVVLCVDGRTPSEARYLLLDPFAATVTPRALRIGQGAQNTAANGTPYVGVIDHLMLWDTSTPWLSYGADMAEGGPLMAGALHDAGRRAWAGQRMDERFFAITNATAPGRVQTPATSGIQTLQSYRQGSPSDLLQTIEDTEQGRIYVDRSGLLCFRSRSWSWSVPEATAVQLTLSDDPDLLDAGTAAEMLPRPTITDDDRNRTTVAQVTSENGRQQTAEADPTVIAEVGRRNAIQLSNLLHAQDRESLNIAQWLVTAYSQPRPRVETVSFVVESDPELLAPIAQTIEEGALVRVVKTQPTGDPIDVQGHVVGVEHSWSHLGWRVTLHLDGARAGWSWFRAGVSEAGGTDVVAF